jgi:putative ABC transport system permease protein
LRKALERPNRSILLQFFLEGLLLRWAAALGMGFAGLLMGAMGTVHGPSGFDPPKLVPMSALLAIGSLTLAGSCRPLSRAQSRHVATGKPCGKVMRT